MLHTFLIVTITPYQQYFEIVMKKIFFFSKGCIFMITLQQSNWGIYVLE